MTSDWVRLVRIGGITLAKGDFYEKKAQVARVIFVSAFYGLNRWGPGLG